MKIFELAFQAAVELQSQRDQETQDYVEQLQEKLVESYTCMLHGFNNKQENEQLLPYFFKLIEFLKRTCNPNLNPTIVIAIILNAHCPTNCIIFLQGLSTQLFDTHLRYCSIL